MITTLRGRVVLRQGRWRAREIAWQEVVPGFSGGGGGALHFLRSWEGRRSLAWDGTWEGKKEESHQGMNKERRRILSY